MSVSATSSVSPLASTNNSAALLPQKVLGQDDFLKLLVTQMTSQDPMNPQKDTDFVAQMAQFSSLQQTKGMSSNLAQLQASDLIGRTVTIQQDSQTVITGNVSSVRIEAGTPKIVVDGSTYTLDKLVGIAPTPTPASN